MKNIFLIIALIIFVSCGNTDELHLTTNSTEWTTVNEDDFSISKPKNWVYKKEPNKVIAFFITSPKTSENDKFYENMNLVKEDLGESGLNLDTYYELALKGISKMNIKIIEKNKETKNGITFYEVLFKFNDKSKSYTVQRYYVNETTAYVLTFSTANKTAYNAYKLIGKQMFNSFRLK